MVKNKNEKTLNKTLTNPKMKLLIVQTARRIKLIPVHQNNFFKKINPKICSNKAMIMLRMNFKILTSSKKKMDLLVIQRNTIKV